MGSYMAYRHHLPEETTAEAADPAAAAQLSELELRELAGE